jgi:hypothetical protein
MSGQLVGEVLDAAEAGLLNGLSPPAFHALLAIAERCHHITRQGTVHKPRIQAAIHTHNSSRTADRAIRALKDAGRIRIVKRGYKAPNGASAPPIYELLTLPKLSPPKVAKASRQAFAKTGQNPAEAFAKSEEAFAKTEQAFATQGGDLNGSINGSSNGEVPPYPPKPETASPQSVTKGGGKTPTPAELDHIDGYRIAEAFSASLPTPLETGLLSDVGVQVNKCLDAGIPPAAIATGLQAWTQSDSWSPTQIPSFVHKANNARPVATSDLRVQQGQALKAKFADPTTAPRLEPQ